MLDIASGSGLVGIAAMKAGAVGVTVSDIDPFAIAAAELNAEVNLVHLTLCGEDVLDTQPNGRWQTILAGDIFYEGDTATRAFAFLADHARAGATILIGDPGRTFLPKAKLVRLADYRVPVTRDLEDAEIKLTAVWTISPDCLVSCISRR
ncbi:putative nicotinamide N-methyase [Bradyrhizobium ottawaense]